MSKPKRVRKALAKGDKGILKIAAEFGVGSDTNGGRRLRPRLARTAPRGRVFTICRYQRRRSGRGQRSGRRSAAPAPATTLTGREMARIAPRRGR